MWGRHEMTEPLSTHDAPSGEQPPCAQDEGQADRAGWQYGTCIEGTVYQCGKCGHCSMNKTNVVNHLTGKTSKCAGAALLSKKCSLPVMALGEKPAVDPVSGTMAPPGGGTTINAANNGGHHNTLTNNVTNNNQVTNNNTFTINVWAITETDRQQLRELVMNEATLQRLATKDPHEVPAALFEAWKLGPHWDCNIRQTPEHVYTRRVGETSSMEPRDLYVKRAVAETLGAVPYGRAYWIDDEAAKANFLELQDKVCQDRPFDVSNKRKVSRLEAAELHAHGRSDFYRLDLAGREFVSRANAALNSTLNKCPPPSP